MPVGEVAALAADTGYQGVELRAHPEEPVHPGIGRSERDAVRREFRRAGVRTLSVCGYARVAAAGPDGPVLDEIADLVGLAGDLGAPYVRVFPGADPGANPGAASAGEEAAEGSGAVAARRLAAAVGPAGAAGVRILLETHDSHRTGRSVARVLSRAGELSETPPGQPPDAFPGSGGADGSAGGGTDGGGRCPAAGAAAGAVWDVLHPWLGGEAPAATRQALSPFLGYVQVKDVASREDLAPLPLGAGVLPLADVLAGLSGLSGLGRPTWLSWEYEKRWAPEAAPLPELLAPGREYLERLLGRGR
ncbi:sugar phosphate isomerase/epimerase [Streptomyces qinzhouensis]|uniref:Sugar phosphate isomerase/epimerase n=1 Tax=Streptomyces qinzhouensis TaxID=2599401 RepID=A0A5B8JS87_9ACTN|nr:TIM barrel protein [Streptomyces qinzhouensis]QDY80910.1 sugar phosphate isomerase/epimerase [Streptomyces qinzhouensis]